MTWGIREYLCLAVALALGAALLSVYGLTWWLPIATATAAFAAMQVVK